MSKLVVSNLSINRAELPVVSSLDISVESGAISVVLGANGAGKTTLLEGLSGIIPVAGGSIAIDGREIQKARPSVRSREGLAHVEQGRTVFRQLTTEENLRVSLHPGSDLGEAYALFPEPGCTNTAGTVRALHYAWSGGHRMVAEELPDGRRHVQFGHAWGSELEPGTSFQSAELLAVVERAIGQRVS